jgi:23S rRNA (uracil1939-C5)-methyltransferase
LTSSDTAPERAVSLRAGAELEADFTDLLPNGQGVGRILGVVVFCFGPLPGERARVRIETVKPRYAVAEFRQLLTRSPNRAEPFCPVFGACGGCQMQHLAYDAQKNWKRNVVLNALQRIGGLTETGVGETIGMDRPRAYRNKMALVTDSRVQPPQLGFYRQRSHEIVPIDRCPIVLPELDELLAELVKLRNKPLVRGILRATRHLVARASRSSGQAVLTLTSSGPIATQRGVAPAMRRELPGVAGLANSYDLSSANAIVGRKYRVLDGASEIEETSGGVRYRISGRSFFQVNVAMLERIFDYLKTSLEPAGRVADLYCGSGTFALFFAHHGWSAYGTDEDPRAVAEAEANATLNGLSARAQFEAGRIETLMREQRVRSILERADAIFLDPPRKGCEPAVLDAIGGVRVKRIWYLSCDPATLARDLKFLASKGYRPDVVQPFDMFPQTGHVETLVHLERVES